MLHPRPGFRLGWEQEGRHLIAGTAGDIWGLICTTFIWKNFPSCSEKIRLWLNVKWSEGDGCDEPCLQEPGGKALLTSFPLSKECTGCKLGGERSLAFLGKAERQEVF